MRWPEIVRTTGVRLTLLYAGLFGLSALVLFAVVYWAATAMLVQQTDIALEAERAALEMQAPAGGSAGMRAAVRERMQRPGNSLRYLLQDASGHSLAGDFP